MFNNLKKLTKMNLNELKSSKPKVLFLNLVKFMYKNSMSENMENCQKPDL